MSRKTRAGCHAAFRRVRSPGAKRVAPAPGDARAGPDRRAVLGACVALGWRGAARASNAAVRLRFHYDGWPSFADWGAELQRRVDIWWPAMTAALASPGYIAPDRVDVDFIAVTPETAARLSGTPLYRRLGVQAAQVAAITRGAAVHVNAAFLAQRLGDPDTFGMMAHELTHVVQAYPHTRSTWLAEGIADYVRYYVLLPDDPRRAFDGRTARYDEGYAATAGFLDWVERARPGAVRTVNAAQRQGRDGASVLRHICGEDLEAAWRAYLATAPEAIDPGAAG